VGVVNSAASIVCGIDHSAGGRAAASFAADLAERLGLRVALVYVVQPPIPQSGLGMAARTTDSVVIQELRSAGVKLLEEVAQELDPGREVIAEIRFGGASEALWRISPQYRYFVVIDYNSHPRVAGRGSAIFLHVAVGATAGCVSLPERQLLRLLRGPRPAAHPLISTAIS